MRVIDIIKKDDGLDLSVIKNHPYVLKFIEFPYNFIMYYFHDKFLEQLTSSSLSDRKKLKKDPQFYQEYQHVGKEKNKLLEPLHRAFSERMIIIAGGACPINDHSYNLTTIQKKSHLRTGMRCERLRSNTVRIVIAFKKNKKDGTKASQKVLTEWIEWANDLGNIEKASTPEPIENGVELIVTFAKDMEDSIGALFWMMNENRNRTNIDDLICEDYQKLGMLSLLKENRSPYPYYTDTYTTLTLTYTKNNEIERLLSDEKYDAFISPAHGRFTVVFDTAESGEKNIAQYLSKTLECKAIRVTNVKNDVLIIDVYANGEEVVHYISNPDYFSFDGSHSPPQGIDGSSICRVMGDSCSSKDIDAILSSRISEDGDYVDETERHEDFAIILRLPPYSVGYSYEILDGGDFPPDFSEDDFIRVEA